MEAAKINCEIFCREEGPIKGMADQIGQIPRSDIRKIRAEDLLDKVDDLLDCWMYEERRSSCRNCQLISNLRKKAALFVIGIAA